MGRADVSIGVTVAQIDGSSSGSAAVALDKTLPQMNIFRYYVSILADPGSKDENKLKAAQLLKEDLKTIILSPHYLSFLDYAMNIFLKVLSEGEPLFVSEYQIQRLRKTILEIVHRFPKNGQLKKYFAPTLVVLYKIIDIDNEENVIVALKIISEFYTAYRPSFTYETENFLQFAKNIYKELLSHINSVFESRSSIRVKDLSELNVEALLRETYAITPIVTEKKLPEGSQAMYNLIPRANLSLKVLEELPNVFFQMIKFYKEQAHGCVEELIPVIMDTINLQPCETQRGPDLFHREIFVSFLGAQINILSFISHHIKSFQEKVRQHSSKFFTGTVNLLRLCPDEVAFLRKTLLLSMKCIIPFDLINGFVPHIEKLLDENLFFGKGRTVYETLRPLGYWILVDLILRVREKLDLGTLARAVNLFSKNIHDETLPTETQIKSCKLFVGFVDSIKKQIERNMSELPVGHDLLMKMLHVFVKKFKSISRTRLPYLKSKEQNSIANSNSVSLSDAEQKDGSFLSDTEAVEAFLSDAEAVEAQSISKLMPSCAPSQSYSVFDCKLLVKTLVSGVKFVTEGCSFCKTLQENGLIEPFYPKETFFLIKFVKWAIQSFEIYALTTPDIQPQLAHITQMARSKEEKEILDHFASIFFLISSRNFKEIFTISIDFVVERFYINPSLQIVANSFLSRPETSTIFATILVEYLLNHMEEVGSQSDKGALYLKLFKNVFGYVSLLGTENEKMLKRYLHQIVNRSMELAVTARDPYNYLLLLRALFRNLGNGNHEFLYQELLLLLPTLLQGLNRLQNDLHEQHMKDILVELCLIVPVPLSSLLPFLPHLVNPIVSALNGSQTLVSQGLKRLELYIDNIEADFIYERLQPILAELLQALWKILRNQNEMIAQTTFRVLGKLGGVNHKMTKPQLLDYTEQEVSTSCMTIHFPDHKAPIMLPVDKIIDAALIALRASNTESWYRQQCWEVIRGFLIGSLQMDEDRFIVSKLLTHPSFIESDIPNLNGQYYKCPDEKARKVQQTALIAMFVAAALKDLRDDVFQTMIALVRHYTIVAVVQQAGPFCLNGRWIKAQGMDPLVLIDSVAIIMGHEERELCKPGHLALMLIINAAADILGSKERASQLPIMEYIVEKMCNLCYDETWYAKLGGCIAISILSDHMALKWVLDHQYILLRALFYVMMDLTDKISKGVVEKAKSNLERMLIVCTSPLKGENDTEELRAAKDKSLHNVTHELVRQITSSNTTVREQAIQSLKKIGELTQREITEVMMPYKEIIAEMIIPKKYLALKYQPYINQIGLMDGHTFLVSLNPRMFTLDIKINEHKSFFNDIVQLVKKNDAELSEFPCFKNISNIIPLRKSALRALSACHYIPGVQELIFLSMYQVLNNSPYPELQETAFECLQKYLKICTVPRNTIFILVEPLLSQVCQEHNITLPVIQRFSYLTQFFPSLFREKLCDYLIEHLYKLLDSVVSNGKQNMAALGQDNNDLKLYAIIVDIFHQIPSASSNLIETLCKLVLHAEMGLMMEVASPFRDPLMKFLLKYPSETIQHFLSDMYSVDQQYGRFLEYLVKHKKGEPFRQALRGSGERLLTMIVPSTSFLPVQVGGVPVTIHPRDKMQQQYLSIKLMWNLTKSNQALLTAQPEIITALQDLWTSDEFHSILYSGEGIELIHLELPRLIVLLLLRYFKQNTNEIKLLFQLLKVFVSRYINDFQFLREFLDQTVAQTYSVDWKRSTFFQFVEVFENLSVSQKLKAKILQHIIIPCFSVSLDRGEGDNLLGFPPAPDEDHADNLVSVFINKIVPEDASKYNDDVRIMLLQLSSLFVEKASAHIHDAANKCQGVKLRRLMTFAWPCLLSKNCVDPATKYHGHLLLSHIIAKFAIHEGIVLEVFRSLLKAHSVEAKAVVSQALEILTPAMPVRMEKGHKMLVQWTRKILIEDGHSDGQLVHILQGIVRNSSVYYPVRHHLMRPICQAVGRLGFKSILNLDQYRLLVDLAEVCIKWEKQRIAKKAEADSHVSLETISQTSQVKRSNSADGEDLKCAKLSSFAATSSSLEVDSDVSKPFDKSQTDLIVYFLLRLPCQVNESTPTPEMNPPGEELSKRCVMLLKRALQPDIWPNSEPKLGWLDKLFVNSENSNRNLTNISVGLELLTYLIGTLRKERILIAIKSVTKGLLACVTHSNRKIINLTHNLLAKLMSMFPMDPANPTSSKFKELEDLYTQISKTVNNGLVNYQRNNNVIITSIYGPLMMIKAASQSNPFYLDRIISPLVEVMQKVVDHHLNSHLTENSSPKTELLILSLELVKNRIGVLGLEQREYFFCTILVGLIEKTPEVVVMKAIIKIIEEWVKDKSLIGVNQGPTMKEKSILLVKLMHVVEKRFPDDTELIGNYLEIVIYVYQDETFQQTELISELEPAFLAGLRCTQPHIRARFFQVFQGKMTKKLPNRLLYIVCSQNWEKIGPNYWIKQCIELLLVAAKHDVPIINSWEAYHLPTLSSMISCADAAYRENFFDFDSIKKDASEELPIDVNDKVVERDLDALILAESHPSNQISVQQRLNNLIHTQNTFMKSTKELMSGQFLAAVAQLCQIDTSLSEWLWIKLFPTIWRILSESQQQCLIPKIQSFIASGIHNIQRECHPSALGTFIEALTYCQPSIPIQPSVMQYLGKKHNLWHRMTLMMEQAAQDVGAFSILRNSRRESYLKENNTEQSLPPITEAINSLSLMYCALKEEDLWAALWQTFATYQDTKMAVSYEQYGVFDQAKACYECVMSKAMSDMAVTPAPRHLNAEMDLWQNHWIRCSKELNEWQSVLEFGRSEVAFDPLLVLQSSLHVPDWPSMKDALLKVEEVDYSEDLAWKINLYRGYLVLHEPEKECQASIEKLVDVTTRLCVKEWKRLPAIVSHVHLTYLQAAQQVLELQEAEKIHSALRQADANSFHIIKGIMKKWRFRLPLMGDGLSHWSDVFTWRQQLYQRFINKNAGLEECKDQYMFGVHALAQDIIQFGKIARKHNSGSVCLDSLSKVHRIPSLYKFDIFHKIKQQVKCLQMAALNDMGKTELLQGLEKIDSTNVAYLKKDMIAELYALKGSVLTQLGRIEEANKALSASVQLDDTLVKGWATWGDYFEGLFIRDPTNINLGVSAITCFLNTARHKKESISRKPLAKVFWLLTFDDDAGSLIDALDKYSVSVPAVQWLPWVPQLLECITRTDDKYFQVIIKLLYQVAEISPQAVYLPVRNQYLTLKIEHYAISRTDSSALLPASEAATTQPSSSSAGNETVLVKCLESMKRCSQIINTMKQLHPTFVVPLEFLVEQLSSGSFRENFYEDLLRKLRLALRKSYTLAYENSDDVTESVITPRTLSFIEKLIASFDTSVDGAVNLGPAGYACARTETTTGRQAQHQMKLHLQAFKKLKSEFKNDFSFKFPSSVKLYSFINKLKKWILLLEIKNKELMKWFMLEDKCKFISDFSYRTADVELPGEFLTPKQPHYYIKIAGFLPRVDIIQKHEMTPRRLYIRGHNGRVYPFLVMSNSSLGDSCREERVLQLMRMLNQFFVKQKETSRRSVNLNVMRVQTISPQMRLVEDNVSSLSLLDIYKLRCRKRVVNHNLPINKYYDKLSVIQANGSQATHNVLRDIIKDVQLSLVPKTIVKDWAISAFPNPMDYWTFRKVLTIQLSLVCLMEYSLHLTRLYPDMMHIHQDSGLINVSYFKFNIDIDKGELDGNWPVPFRLTPNLAELITTIGLTGPFTAVMVSTARCLSTPSYKVVALLRAILKDEIISLHKKQDSNILGSGGSSSSGQQTSSRIDKEIVISRVNKAVTTIANRIQSLATVDRDDNKVAQLVRAVNSVDNLCRMDPAWHPWL